jgi:hypothetical protein
MKNKDKANRGWGGKREGAGRPRIHPVVDKPKGKRGGKREGAGRPKSERQTVRLGLYIPQDLVDFMDFHGNNRSAIINKCIRYVMNLNNPNIFNNNTDSNNNKSE